VSKLTVSPMAAYMLFQTATTLPTSTSFYMKDRMSVANHADTCAYLQTPFMQKNIFISLSHALNFGS